MAAPGLSMIRESIYTLKREYGLKIAIINVVSVTDLGTGRKVSTYTSKIIKNAILLPQSALMSLAKIFNLSKVGSLETDDRSILIDKTDLKGFPINDDSFVGYDGDGLTWRDLSNVDWNNLEDWNTANNANVKRQDIKNIEDSLYAVALSVTGLNGAIV